jgi:CP family cyanate transporter-like MFS transporter
MTKSPGAASAPARRPLEAALLVASVAAMGFNLRAAITSLPPVFPELQARLGLPAAEVSALASTPVLCFGVVSGVAAWLSRRAGEERVLLAALAALSCGLLLRGALPGPMLFPGTVLASAAIAVMNVLLSSMIKRRWPERAGLLIGVYLTFLSVGAVLGSLVSVPLYNASGGSVALTLGLWGLPAIVAMLVWLSQARYGPPARKRPPSPAAGVLAAGVPAAAHQARAESGRARRARGARAPLYRHALAWQVMAFMGLQSLLYYSTLSWLPELFRDRGATPVAAGDLLALMGFGNLVTSLVIPVLAHRVADQRILAVPTVLVSMTGIAGSLYAPLGTAAVWMLVLGMSQGSALGLAIFFTVARSPDPVTAASLSAFAQALGYLLATAGPLAVGFLHTLTRGWNLPVLVMLVLGGAEAAAGWLAARPKVLPAARVPRGDSGVPVGSG